MQRTSDLNTERTTWTPQEQDTLPSSDTATSLNVKDDSSSSTPSPTDLESLQDRRDVELDSNSAQPLLPLIPGKMLTLSEPHTPHLQNGNESKTV